ncbi:hypothetical protein PUNSTDRAFT_144431 [Punctularia strigosozonata HHB-11173 SS5]|uniref:uncharacterized protein n=1 Tax=Punctularia strigosozonata (strain HHB-11173) TaxID=741275 RepID=UPI0004417620|nr:uncharacterized protein PUNSTDRAFT_144431 [Punctularia strigosozonata HHB-11173 SS5]EIN07954.1 hypothetical protein PUNSTDRAFT_144431 [Punctularia strigosozonata HHB-11173 SS5]
MARSQGSMMSPRSTAAKTLELGRPAKSRLTGDFLVLPATPPSPPTPKDRGSRWRGRVTTYNLSYNPTTMAPSGLTVNNDSHLTRSKLRRVAPEIGGSEGGFIGLVVGLCLIIVICCVVVVVLLRKPEPTPADRARRRRQMQARQSAQSSSNSFVAKIRAVFSSRSGNGHDVPSGERGFSLERGRKIIRGLSMTSTDRRVRGWLQASGDDWDDADEVAHWRDESPGPNANRWSGSTISGDHAELPKDIQDESRSSFRHGAHDDDDDETDEEGENRVEMHPVRRPSPELHIRPAGAATPVVVALHHPTRDRQGSVAGERGMTPSTEGPGHSREGSADTAGSSSTVQVGRPRTRDSTMSGMTSPTGSIWTFERGTKFKENI